MEVRRRDERGATTVIVAVVLSAVLLVSAAFAVDLGQQRVVRRDVQAVADMVALDLARNLDGRAANLYAVSTFDNAKHNSLKRNADALGGRLADSDLTWEFVKEGATAGTWVTVPTSSTDVPTAVRVTATSDTGLALGGVTGQERGGSTRTAIASNADATVCFSVGTKTLTLDTSGSALSPLLDSILRVNLDAVGYEGIVNLKNAYVPLADLMIQLGVGSYDELATTNVSLGDFVVAAADVLRAQGNTAGATVLESIEIGVENADLSVGDILGVESGQDPSGLTADVNVLDLLSAAIVAANGDHAVEAEIPGIASLTIIEPPQVKCGVNVTAYSAQIRATLSPTVPAGMLPLGVASAAVNGQIDVGRGEATLKALGCGPKSANIEITTGAASATATVTASVTTARVLNLLPVLLRTLVSPIFTLLGINRIDIESILSAYLARTGPEERTVTWPDPPGQLPPIVLPEDGISDTLDLQLGTPPVKITSTGLVGALGSLLGDVLGVVVGIVNPLLDAVDDNLLTPLISELIDFLGLKLGVAEVTMHGEPACANVKLVG